MTDDRAFKNWINHLVVKKMASTFKSAYPAFDQRRFIQKSLGLKELELKARVKLLAEALQDELPGPFRKDAKILKKIISSKRLKGFELWPLSELISQNGLEDFELAFDLMVDLTQEFTSEFAIRPFLEKDPERSLAMLKKWIKHPSPHVRRWVSEGTRPNLPWGGRISHFIKKPQTLDLLDQLKWDDSLYVRKSVANHLNDITKTHPDLVLKVLKQWETQSTSENLKKILWIKRHGLRTLIKKGNSKALKLMGASSQIKLKIHYFKLNKTKFNLGDNLEFEIKLESLDFTKQKIIVDYGIGFLKADGSQPIRIFKLKSLILQPGEKKVLSKKHSLKKITTLRYYSGKHSLVIQINGKIYQKLIWIFHARENVS